MQNCAKEWVYFAQVGNNGPIKVGTARNVKLRISHLQIGSPEIVHLRAVIPGGRDVERAIHRRLVAARMRGEWFFPCDEMSRILDEARGNNLPEVKPRRAHKERLPPDQARDIWLKHAGTGAEALERMPGWTYHSAVLEFGQRPFNDRMTSERARKMRAKQLEESGPPAREAWSAPEMAKERLRWEQFWRDPKHRGMRDGDVFDLMPARIRKILKSQYTARNILGPRRPNDPSAGGRGKKRKRKR